MLMMMFLIYEYKKKQHQNHVCGITIIQQQQHHANTAPTSEYCVHMFSLCSCKMPIIIYHKQEPPSQDQRQRLRQQQRRSRRRRRRVRLRPELYDSDGQITRLHSAAGLLYVAVFARKHVHEFFASRFAALIVLEPQCSCKLYSYPTCGNYTFAYVRNNIRIIWIA